MELESVGTDNAGGWRHAFDGTDHSNPGRYYQEGGNGSNLTYDMGLALTVPEPATMGLLVLGGLVALRRRKR